jgi:hypothetical protein
VSTYVVVVVPSGGPTATPTATNTPTPTATNTPTPTPSSGVNLALNKIITASSSIENYGWYKVAAVDGQRSAVSGAMGWTSDNSIATNHTEWVTVDLGASNTVNKVDLYPRNDSGNVGYGFPIDFTISTSPDNTNWTTVITRTGYAQPGGTVQSFTFSNQTARYIKVQGTSLRANPSDSNSYRMQFAEIEVYGGSAPTSTPTSTPTNTPTPIAGSIIINDFDASGVSYTGVWGTATGQGYNNDVHYITASGSGSNYAIFTPNIPTAGIYNVYARWSAYTNRPTNAPYTVYYNGGNATVNENQQINGDTWVLLGTWSFAAGTGGYVKLSDNCSGDLIADAVKFEPASVTTINDTDSGITYNGAWTYSSSSSGYYNNDCHYISTNGSYCQYTFTGTGIRWIGAKNGDHGYANVYIDGTLVATVDTYASTWQKQLTLYEKTGLSSGSHTIKVEVTNTKNASSSNYTQDIDAFVYFN